jgi:hypothetical protein
MVKKVNGGDNLIDSKNIDLAKMAIHIHGRMEHNLANMPNTILIEAQKSRDAMNSQEKLNIVKNFFLNIGKQMLETSYTLNLGQLF